MRFSALRRQKLIGFLSIGRRVRTASFHEFRDIYFATFAPIPQMVSGRSFKVPTLSTAHSPGNPLLVTHVFRVGYTCGLTNVTFDDLISYLITLG
jgi:hypothetical protein